MRAITLALILAAGWSTLAAAQSIGGDYRVQGTNPNGSPYSGTAEIAPSGDTCRIVWHVGTVWRGICMLSGGTFAASYRSGATFRFLRYQLQPDRSPSAV